MTPQTGVFPRIHTSYNIYELLIHEMTHDTANEGDPGLASRSAPLRDGPGTGPEQTSAVRARTQPGRGPGADPGPARSRDGRPVVEARGPGADPTGAGPGAAGQGLRGHSSTPARRAVDKSRKTDAEADRPAPPPAAPSSPACNPP